MKNLLLVLMLSMTMFGCSRVGPGEAGVKIYLTGGDKGVDHEVLGTGRYYIGINEELEIFPTFQQTHVWTQDKAEGSLNDESINFQSKDGLSLGADIGITYHIKKSNVSKVFQKYRKGIEEITDVILRNMVRDAFVTYATSYSTEESYSTKKVALMDSVSKAVTLEASEYGITVEKIYYIGSMRLPKQVLTALNNKIRAIQKSQQIENEVRSAKAQAQKVIATSRGKAESILLVAEAQAKANKLIQSSITPRLVEYEKIKKWNGVLPRVTGSNAIISLKQ